jgi:CRP-like cAMP-binding protein
LKTSKILKEVNNDVVINNIYNSIKEKRLFRGEYLVKNGENFDRIYIIRKGFFQVNLNIKQKINNVFNDLNYFGRFSMKEKSENIKYELKNCYYKNEKYRIVTYGEGEIIGDIEAHLGCNTFLTDVFCNTDSSLVYEITIEDFYSYSNKTMKEALNEEGKQKLQYYRERIHSITTINSKKLNNANKFKEIISNKLEEEKGHIFNRIENSSNGKLKYEKKQRKRLKSSFVNHKLKKILDQISVQQSTGLNTNDNKFINYKNHTEKHNKYKIKFKKEPIEVFRIFSTSIQNNKLIKSNEFSSKKNKDHTFNKDIKDYKDFQENKEKSIVNFDKNNSQYVKTTTSYTKNYNSIKKLFTTKVEFDSIIYEVRSRIFRVVQY